MSVVTQVSVPILRRGGRGRGLAGGGGRSRGWGWGWGWVVVWLWVVLLGGRVGANAVEEPGVDAWCSGTIPGLEAEASPGWFEDLKASVVGEERRLAVVWAPPREVGTNGAAVVEVSTGRAGHWPSRDWKRWPMQPSAEGWRAMVAVASVEAPLVYFVRYTAPAGGRAVASPLRLFRTVASDLTTPTFVFNGFLDGFEEGIPGWEAVAAGLPETVLQASAKALTGRGALRMEVPPGRASVTVGTVRVQGWMLEEHAPVALRFAARTESGDGQVHCDLHGFARTPQVAIYPTQADFPIGPEWRRLEVPMEAFTGLRPGTVDWFTIQFRAESGRALLVDDLELVLR